MAGPSCSRDQLLDLVHEHDTPAFDRGIDVRIGRVRRKLGDDPSQPAPDQDDAQ
jgi:DNA-binding response OmpR family regulator